MYRLITLLSVLFLCLYGCLVGRNFSLPDTSELLLGQTTKEEIVAKFGTPKTSDYEIINGVNVEKNVYLYISQTTSTEYSSVVAAKILMLNYVDNVLVGYAFSSTSPEDSTYVAPDILGKVVKGWTKNDVVRLLGEPSGMSIPPISDEMSPIAFDYPYIEFVMGLDMFGWRITYKQNLLVYFDDEERVIRTRFVSRGEKAKKINMLEECLEKARDDYYLKERCYKEDNKRSKLNKRQQPE